MLAYVQNSPAQFNLSTDQILYLRDIGIPSSVITAMLTRDSALRTQPQSQPTYTYDQRAYPATVPPPPPVTPVPEPAPSVQPETATAPPPPAQAPAPVYVSSPPPEVSYFYDSLSPYGTWIQLEGVGWCWQPRVVVVNRAWQPYCDAGHWIWTDAGWFWVSDYSWGWAPFHYGRWHHHASCGWVWLPDRVWGPSWVVWRSEGAHCGWAPLPPHSEFVVGVGWRFNGVAVGVNFDFGLHPEQFTFVAMNNFNHHDLGHYRLPPTEVTRIYNHTTIINNYTVNHTTIINHGVPVERVAAATHSDMRKVPIREAPASAGHAMPTQGMDRGKAVVYRTELKAPARTTGFVAQKVDDRHPVVQHAPVAPARSQSSSASFNSPAASDTSRTLHSTPGHAQTVPGNEQQSWASQSAGGARGVQGGARPPASSSTSVARTTTEHTANSSHLYPLGSGGQSQPLGPQTSSSRQSPQYYPKSYHQAAETHALPPLNQYGSAPVSQGDHGNSGKKKD